MARYTIDFYSKSLLRRVKIQLIIPSLNLTQTLRNPDENYYQNRKETFPLMICLNGFGDNEDAFLRNTSIDDLCEKNGVAAVFINGENKFYLNQGPLDNYYDLIEKDVLDFLYGNYTNLSKEKALFITGISMGGFGALYHYLKNVDKYAHCFALSPATKPDNFDEEKHGSLKGLFLANKDKKLNCYISIGENDFIINASKELNQFLLDNKIDANYKFIPNYDHSWPLWRIEIVNVFDYLKTKGLIG